jgi:hypothetical protein
MPPPGRQLPATGAVEIPRTLSTTSQSIEWQHGSIGWKKTSGTAIYLRKVRGHCVRAFLDKARQRTPSVATSELFDIDVHCDLG